MNYYLSKISQSIEGQLTLPYSKSLYNRKLLLDALCGAPEPILERDIAEDISLMAKGLYSLDPKVYVGASGTAMRFLTAYYALKGEERMLFGTSRMHERPIGPLVDALNSIGASIHYKNDAGYPPVHIKASKLKGGKTAMPGHLGSQFLSALLMIAPCLNEELSIQLTSPLISADYVRMTIAMMKTYGVSIQECENRYRITPQTYHIPSMPMERDWSAAAFWYGMVALSSSSELFLPDLFVKSFQGDAYVANLFRPLGVSTEFKSTGIILRKTDRNCNLWEFNFENNPDLVMVCVVVAVLLKIPFKFEGLQTLRLKETDRIEALIQETAKIGAELTVNQDSVLSWDGSIKQIEGVPCFNTYNDHRMAMSFALVAFRRDAIILDAEVVRKSYPNFLKDWQQLLGNIEEYTSKREY